MHCKICDADAARLGAKTLVLEKYEVQYWRCPSCGFIQTDEPYWLDEAYQSPIAPSDIGYVYRNRSFGWVTRTTIGLFYAGKGPFLDFGGGYGLFVRDMRDRGYDFRLLDKYTPNLFASGYEWEKLPAGTKAELITSFEVLEHLPDPHAGLGEILEHGSELLFSTSIQPAGIQSPADWDYFALQDGQHIALHTVESLRRLGARHGLYLHSNHRYLHLYSRSNAPTMRSLFPWVSRLKIAHATQLMFQKRTLLQRDMGLER